MSNEQTRLQESRKLETPWKKWGPYLSERQWGTVREDYSEDGNAWNYFSHADMALKFLQHFVSIASATIHAGCNTGMWDEEDGFFYDVLQLPDGQATRLKVRSMVGLLPLCAVTVFEDEFRQKYPEVMKQFSDYLRGRPELKTFIHDPAKDGVNKRHLGSILDESKLRRVLSKMLDEKEFLSAYGIRALSRFHADQPYVFNVGGLEYRVGYLPAESDTGMFGGNSNWRGPIWMPVNALIIRALLRYYAYYGNDFTVEYPTGSGRQMNLYQVADEISRRLESIFLKDKAGRRPVNGGTKKFQEDPYWRDHVLFYEYFHGDNGVGHRRESPDRLDRHHCPRFSPVRNYDRGPGSRTRQTCLC